MKNRNEKDLNKLIINDKKGRHILSKIFYSRVIVSFLLIAAQISLFIVFCVKLNPYIEYYFGSALGFSVIFMIYLANSNAKNEFKIVWMVPMVVFPFFGVAAYIMFHVNSGGVLYKKKFHALENQLLQYKGKTTSAKKILQKYETVQDLGTYLLGEGNFFPYENNQITYYSCGEKLLPDMLKALKKAKDFIFIEYFIIDVDETWTQILEILEKKASEGVTVRVLFDGIGSVAASQSSYQKYLKTKGIDSHIFLPLIPFFSTQINNRDHRKILVVDGKVAFTGGINLSNEYFNVGKNKFSYWKDNSIKIEGSGVMSFTGMFLQTWNLQTKTTDDYLKYLSVRPKKYQIPGLIIPYADDAYNNLDVAEDVYCYMINSARKYIYITTPYVVIDNNLMSDLIFAARRGVKVCIAVPAVPDHLLTFCIGKVFQKELMDNGIEIYEYQKGFLHAKTFVCDGIMATVGSVNLDYRSLYHHFECGCFMYDMPVIKEIEQDFNEIVKDSSLMTKESYKKSPAIRRVIGRAFRIFSPLL